MGNFDPLIPPEENSVTEKPRDYNPREQMDVSGGDLLGADEDLQMSMTTAILPQNDEDEMWKLASSDEDKTTSAPQVGDICDMSPMVSQYQWQSDDGWCPEEPSMNDNEFTDVNSPLATGVAADSSDKEDENNRADSLEEMSSKDKGLRELESVRGDEEPPKLITQDHQCREQESGRTSDEKHNASESEPLETELQLLTTISSGCHGYLGDSTDDQSDSTTVKDDNNFSDKAPIIDTDSTPKGSLKSMPEELAKDSMGVSSSFQKNITRGRPTGKSRKTLAVQRENANKKECPNAEDTLPTRKPFPCQQCVENFVDEDLLADHERTHSIDLAAKMNHGDSSQKPLGHSDQNQNLVSCPQMHAKTKHNCGYCDRVYKYYNDLQKHERSHRAEVKQDKFWCRLCHSTFKTRGSFLNHTKVHTTNRRKGKQKSSAKKKKYRCSFCGKLLSVKRDWIKHERTHTGEKPFNCRICDKAFSMARDARYHETKVHARQLASTSRNETSTVCDNLTVPSSAVATETSGRSASGSSASSGTDTAELLDSTLSSNSEKDKMPSLTADKTKSSSISQNTPKESQLKNKHTCCFCPSSFATKQRLWSHIEYHRVAHSHKCSYCPRLCAYESARKIHERSHTGERPFKCKLCTKSFIRKSHLNRHLKRVPHPEAD
ncbi:putative zinc finger protein [Apostichopus japonicus]|uniref:Putative zinc finger protein n=1 Tax=Stichopus japonicus TaxID=307972 RepID=A0A2G8JMB6_STIJA|nr:putative zinc finger protein [Apostichopus japonicus]